MKKPGSLTMRAVLLAVGLGGLGALVFIVLVLNSAVFAAPSWLHLAWFVPVLVVCDLLAARARFRARARFGELRAVERLIQGAGRGLRGTRTMLGAGAILLLAVCCARPQWGLSERQLKRRGVDVVICVDVSRSMLAEDVKPNRLGRARIAVDSLLSRLHGDRVSVIAYAGEARVLCPLTLDHGAARLFLDTLDVDLLQRPGTAIATALERAGQALSRSEGRHGVVLLLSDGEDHGGEAIAAAEDLAEQGIVVHAIGLGRTEGVPIPLREGGDPRGKVTGFIKDFEGNAVMSKLDPLTLRAVAEATGGQFFPAGSAELGLFALAKEIASMDQQEFSSSKTVARTDRYQWFLMPALLLLAIEAFLPDGGTLRRRKEPLSRMSAAAEAAS